MDSFIRNDGLTSYGPVAQAQFMVVGNDAMGFLRDAVGAAAPQKPDKAALARSKAQFKRLPKDAVPEPGEIAGPHRLPVFYQRDFLGRERELRGAAAALRGRRGAALVGPPGAGKSQLAAEIAHRYGRYFAGGVFWLSSETAETAEAEVVQCAAELGFPAGAGAAASVRLAWGWPLARLLVFDNCEDEAVLRAWLPPAGGCKVLVTSQRRDWPPEFDLDTIEVGPLARDDSVRLLRRLSGMAEGGRAELDAIAAAVDDLPLALVPAGAALRGGSADDARDWLADLGTGSDSPLDRSFAAAWARLRPDEANGAAARDVLGRAAGLAAGEWLPRALLSLAGDGPDSEAERRLRKGIKRAVSAGLLQPADNQGVVLHRQLHRYLRAGAPDAGALDAEAATVLRLAAERADLVDTRMLPHLTAALARTTPHDPLAAGYLHIATGRLAMLGMLDFGQAATEFDRAAALADALEGHPADAAQLLATACWAQACLYLVATRLDDALSLLGSADSLLAKVPGPSPYLLARISRAMLGLPWQVTEAQAMPEAVQHFVTGTLTVLRSGGAPLVAPLLDLLLALAQRFASAGALGDAERSLAEATAVAGGLPGDAAQRARMAALLLVALHDVRRAAGDPGGAARALAEGEGLLTGDAARDTGQMLLAAVFTRQGRHPDAARALRTLLSAAEATTPLQHRVAGLAMGMQALDAGDLDGALQEFEAAAAPDARPGPGSTMLAFGAAIYVGHCLRLRGDAEAGCVVLRRAAEAGEAGAESEAFAGAVIATLIRREFPFGSFLGWEGLEARLAAALATLRALYGPDHPLLEAASSQCAQALAQMLPQRPGPPQLPAPTTGDPA